MSINNGKSFLITSALPYANWPLHVWHVAGVHLPADIYYRFLKSLWENCLSLCGTDEHWVWIEIAAEKRAMTEAALVEHYREEIFQTLEKINIRYDILKGTHVSEHMQLSQHIFQQLLEKWFIEKRQEKQIFCMDCERFLPDRYVEGTCPNCGALDARGDQCEKCSKLLNPIDLIDPCCKICNHNNLQEKNTYNYYFLLSKIQNQLHQWIEKTSMKKNVKTTAQKWLKEGLEDRSISRDIKRGIPIPWDTGKKMYVWFEAPISYISFLDEIWKTIWTKGSNSEIVHFLGKDNIPFHTIIRPAILLAEWQYKLPDKIIWNEFVNLEGKKISTSRDHAVRLRDIVEEYPSDCIRNYLINCIPETKDSNFSREEFKQVNDNIANSLWNLIHRLYTFYNRFFNGYLKNTVLTEEYLLNTTLIKEKVVHSMKNYKIREAFNVIMLAIKELNKIFQEKQPWSIVKEHPEEAYKILNTISVALIDIAILLYPFLPETSERILDLFWLDARLYTYWNIGDIKLPHIKLRGNMGYIFDKIPQEKIQKELFKLLEKNPESSSNRQKVSDTD